ncbi:hypothetical protein NDA15_006671 [Ustilago hordei]|nr:hypothetical protein NDA15_006671 [Ustilago hordei]
MNDAVKLGKELDSIWNDAARLGKHFNEDLKKSTLYRCMAQDWFYANAIDALKTARPDLQGLIENGARHSRRCQHSNTEPGPNAWGSNERSTTCGL